MSTPPSAADGASGPASTRTAWLVFAPPFAVLLLRFWLNTLAESGPDAQPLRAVQALGDGTLPADDAIATLVWQAALPALLTLAVAVALGLLWRASVRRWGWPRVRPWLLLIWPALCALAGAGLALQYLNGARLEALPDADARVVQARAQPASERGPGGALVVLTLAGDPTPRRVLLPDADVRALPPGQVLRLQRARGRFWGEFVTGSDAPAPAAAPDAAPPAGR